jgi:DNA-binding GntR family transcriptional regulator
VRGRIAVERIARKGGGFIALVELHEALLEKLRAQDVQASTALVRQIFSRVADVF